MSFLKPHAIGNAPRVFATDAQAAPQAAQPTVDASLHALDALAEARQRSERIIQSELQRLEDSFIVTLKALEDRLALQQQEFVELQRKYDRLLQNQLTNERSIQTLKELKRVLDSV